MNEDDIDVFKLKKKTVEKAIEKAQQYMNADRKQRKYIAHALNLSVSMTIQ